MKRARYTGASGTGVDLTVTLPDGQIRNVHVPHGELTPETYAGQPFPEELVKSLLEQDGWEPATAAKAPTKTGEQAGGKE